MVPMEKMDDPIQAPLPMGGAETEEWVGVQQIFKAEQVVGVVLTPQIRPAVPSASPLAPEG